MDYAAFEKSAAIIAIAAITVVGIIALNDKEIVNYGILAIGSLAGSTAVSSLQTLFKKRDEDGTKKETL